MTESSLRTRMIIDATSRLRLQKHVKLRRDATRDRWIILAPERIFSLNAEAVAALKLCTGDRTVAEIARTLSQDYDAEDTAILTDIIPMLQDLADKGVVGT